MRHTSLSWGRLPACGRFSTGLLVSVLLLCGSSGQSAMVPVSQHALLLEPVDGVLNVTEMFRLENRDTTPFIDRDKGTIQFYVPKAALASAQATVQGASGTTARLPLEKTAEQDIFKLTYGVKPGVTLFEIRYALPASGKFSGRSFGPDTPRIISSHEVALSGKNIRFLSKVPRSQANVYELVNTNSGEPFEILIDGTGSVNTPSEEQAPERQPTRGPARIFERLHSLLALTGAALCIGGALLYRRTAITRSGA
jgi:hypothetical protein